MAPSAQPPAAIANGTTLPPISGSGKNGSSALRACQTKASASATDAPIMPMMVGDSQA